MARKHGSFPNQGANLKVTGKAMINRINIIQATTSHPFRIPVIPSNCRMFQDCFKVSALLSDVRARMSERKREGSAHLVLLLLHLERILGTSPFARCRGSHGTSIEGGGCANQGARSEGPATNGSGGELKG